MKRVVSSAIGTFAGIFIMLSMFQALLSIQEFKLFFVNLINSIVSGLLIGAVIAGIVGLVLLYLSMKGKF